MFIRHYVVIAVANRVRHCASFPVNRLNSFLGKRLKGTSLVRRVIKEKLICRREDARMPLSLKS